MEAARDEPKLGGARNEPLDAAGMSLKGKEHIHPAAEMGGWVDGAGAERSRIDDHNWCNEISRGN